MYVYKVKNNIPVEAKNELVLLVDDYIFVHKKGRNLILPFVCMLINYSVTSVRVMVAFTKSCVQ